MKKISIAIFALTLCAAQMSCSAEDAESTRQADSKIEPPASKTQSDHSVCLDQLSSDREMDVLEAELACQMALGDNVKVKFVGTDETYGCQPQVVAVAPKSSRREYVRIALTHGTQKEFTAVVRLENKVLKDRKSGWRNYGWPGNAPLEPCSALPMKVESITCKLSGEPDFKPCDHDVELLPPGLFLSETFLAES